MDSHLRSAAKTLSYRVFGLFVTGGIALVITGDLSSAITIGAADTLLKLGAYYAHERLWNCVRFGRAKPPEYEI